MDEYTVKVHENRTEWYIEGKKHREGGPAVEWNDGDKWWYIEGKKHREDGPAVEHSSGYKAWYIEGKLHREDGPAIEFSNGDKEWHIEGVNYTEEEFNKKINTKVSTKTIVIDGKEIGISLESFEELKKSLNS